MNCGLKPKFLTIILGHIPELYHHNNDDIIQDIITVEITSGTFQKITWLRIMITLIDKPSLKKKQQQGPGLTSNLLDCCASMGKTQVQNEGTWLSWLSVKPYFTAGRMNTFRKFHHSHQPTCTCLFLKLG